MNTRLIMTGTMWWHRGGSGVHQGRSFNWPRGAAQTRGSLFVHIASPLWRAPRIFLPWSFQQSRRNKCSKARSVPMD